MSTELDAEAQRATSLLVGKTVRFVRRHRDSEVVVEFEDGTRLFVDAKLGGAVEMSITGEPDQDARELSQKGR